MLALMLAGLLLLAGTREGGAAAMAGPARAQVTVLRRAWGILSISLLVGLSETAIYALLPVYGVRQGLSTELAVSMVIAYSLGEIVIALPIGWVADRMNRLRLLAHCCTAAALTVFLLMTVRGGNFYAWGIAALAGGLIVSLHNIALIILGEQFRGSELPLASTAFSMSYALGSAGGSAIGGLAMALLGPPGLPLAVGSSLLAYSAYLALARRRTPA
jgi:predicted MFS family arabinose efflux permease